MLKLLGEGKCNCNAIVFGNKYITSNMYITFSNNFFKDGDEEDIEYEDETEKRRRMRQKISALSLYVYKKQQRVCFSLPSLKVGLSISPKNVLFASLKVL